MKGQQEPAAAWTGLRFTPALSGHPHQSWYSRLAGLLQCSPPFLQQQLCPDRNAKRVPYVAQGCYHVTELKDPN